MSNSTCFKNLVCFLNCQQTIPLGITYNGPTRAQLKLQFEGQVSDVTTNWQYVQSATGKDPFKSLPLFSGLVHLGL